MPKYEFTVEMTCGGCSGAVERVLKKKEGIDNFEVDLEKKKVFVETSMTSDEVLEVLKKTGKATTYVGTA
ncbi:copper transport protein ATOX1-like [Antedon mediterranea]|uniref:copper transport protein ATOX1-like n=1 Tax=Antedon mediterranea TaxID=105859 RepID=UPI003AF56F90